MKKLLLLAACAVMLSSCLKDSSSNGKGPGLKIVDNYLNTKSFSVPVLGDGTVTQVVYHRADGESEILATTDVPLTIQIPAWLDADVNRSGDSEGEGERISLVDYAAGTIDFEANSWIKDGNSVLMFEDSRVGDFDYNDLVVYVRHSIKGNNTASNPAYITITVKPIALGGVHDIAFGWEDAGGEHMLSEDVRTDYFNGLDGIINTFPNLDFIEPIVVGEGCGNEVCEGYTIFKDRALMERARHPEDAELDLIVGGYIKYDPVRTTCSASSNDAKMIKWFIKTGGYKLYVASIDKAAPAGTFPYGVSIPNAGYHAQEGIYFGDVYTKFEDWVRGDSQAVNWGSVVDKTKRYEKHVNYARW